LKRSAYILIFLLAAPLLLGLCLLCGSSGIGLPDLGNDTGRAIFDLRLQRLAAGFLVGAALSCAGVVFQALLRNPLAEPYILGVSSGGALGAALIILAGFGSVILWLIPFSAFAAALLTLTIVYAVATNGFRETPSVYSLILSGVIISSLASSLLMFLIATAPVEGLHSIMWWMLGNLQAPSGMLLAVSGIMILLGIFALWLLTPELNALTFGREMAHHLGVRTRLVIGLGLVLATMVTAAAVALAGLIGFVGLVVPHAVRAVIGPDHRRLLPLTAIAGGVFLALCDAFARTILGNVEIPVGVITAFAGGPFFLILLRRRRQRGWIA